MKTLIRLSLPVFHAQGIAPEAQKALDTFRQAVEREAVTVALARRLVESLRRAQHDASVSTFEAV